MDEKVLLTLTQIGLGFNFVATRQVELFEASCSTSLCPKIFFLRLE